MSFISRITANQAKFTVLISIMSCLMSMETVRAEEIIRIGYFMLPPQAFLKDGKPTGAAVEYWEKYLAPEMGVKVKWYGPYNIKRLALQAKKGQLDAVLVLAKNRERMKIFDYPQKGFYRMVGGVLVEKNYKAFKFKSMKDLEGMRLCFLAGGLIPAPVKKLAIDWKLMFGKEWNRECIQRTVGNKVDGTFDLMVLSLKYSSKLYKMSLNTRTIVIPGLEMPVYTAFSKKADKSFISRYEKAHKRFLKQKRLEEIIASYLKSD